MQSAEVMCAAGQQAGGATHGWNNRRDLLSGRKKEE